MMLAAEPAMFVPVKGTWGLRGAASVRLAEVDVRTMRSGLHHGVAERDRAEAQETRRAAA